MRIGIYNMYFSWLGGGDRRTAALAAHLASRHDVVLFVSSPGDVSSALETFGIDLSGVEIVGLERADRSSAIRAHGLDLFVNNTSGSVLPCPAARGIYMCMFPDGPNPVLDTYDVITANSGYTASWIEKRWGRQAEVVYSACQDIGVGNVRVGPGRDQVVLNVGRFFADYGVANHKRQDVLLTTFKGMVDEGCHGWELVLVGNVGARQEDRGFVEGLQQAALGYPVRVLTNVSFEELRETYRRAMIYWHATGYDTLVELEPGKQEHFGMSIVEAMSAGVVPVVFDSGGPRETVERGVTGLFWEEPEELDRQTRELMNDPRRLRRMSRAAVLGAKRFVGGEYLTRMDRIIDRLTRP